ncbi:MAG: SDR family oxidoreductase [Verrucomicrobia bacterium]|nr:SDR family oxidoreductase [Verrucomicrobiota bacterium]
MPEVIIIGQDGYIGEYLLHYLKCHSKDNVIAVSSKDCDFLDADAVAGLFKSLKGSNYRVIFLPSINRSVENSFGSFIKNISMVKNFIDNAKQISISSIIYLSSVDVYGKNSILPITENTIINPDTWYGLSKFDCEWMLGASGNLDYPATILRIPGVFGYSPRDKSVIGQMVATIKSERRVYIHGTGQSMRDYVSIDDLCRLIKEILPLKYKGVLNVATGQPKSLIETAHLIGSLLNLGYEIRHVPRDNERYFDLIFDNHRIFEVLPGFRFSDISVGIKSYL